RPCWRPASPPSATATSPVDLEAGTEPSVRLNRYALAGEELVRRFDARPVNVARRAEVSPIVDGYATVHADVGAAEASMSTAAHSRSGEVTEAVHSGGWVSTGTALLVADRVGGAARSAA
ncbi:hypothetical protein ACFQZ8_04660, partial [Micromonospora azadirachtae]